MLLHSYTRPEFSLGQLQQVKKKKKGKLTPVQAILQVLSSLHGLSVILLPEVPK